MEIETLKRLEGLAHSIRRSGEDKKWRELATLLGEIFTPASVANGLAAEPAQDDAGVPLPPKPTPSPHQKLVIFTEHRDTLNYLQGRIGTLLGRAQAVVIIHGGMGREDRMRAQEAFRHDPEVQVLLATDAAGEGINLQRAHLMVNYDLPWNPNRIEQRFGRIHRIGQTEVCHLWNLVAEETREGDVYRKLLEKLAQARNTLGGQVFDVLGKLQFDGRSLRDLLIEAIRYGDQPEVRARLTKVVENAFDRDALRTLLEDRALAHDAMDASRVFRIREEMERAEARRLQPHYVESFFLEAFKRLGGAVKQRETRRYEITHVPAPVRNRDRLIGFGEPVMPRYERIAFEKTLVAPQGQPLAAFVCPGHPLLNAVIDISLERYRDLLRRGAVLVDERDAGTSPRVLFFLEHAIQDASLTRSGERRIVSKRLLFVEIDAQGAARHINYAPYLDYRPLAEGEPAIDAILARPECGLDRPRSGKQGADSCGHDSGAGAPRRGARPQDQTPRQDRSGGQGPPDQGNQLLGFPRRAAQGAGARWQRQRAAQLGRGSQAGGRAAGPTAEADGGHQARAPVGAAAARCARRPAGRADGADPSDARVCRRRRLQTAIDTQAAAASAREIVMEIERGLGFAPVDREFEKLGYDIESAIPGTGRLRFIEVKGRVAGADTVTVTKNEILYSLNKPEDFILAIVELDSDVQRVHYVRRPFRAAPDFHAASINYSLSALIAMGSAPA